MALKTFTLGKIRGRSKLSFPSTSTLVRRVSYAALCVVCVVFVVMAATGRLHRSAVVYWSPDRSGRCADGHFDDGAKFLSREQQINVTLPFPVVTERMVMRDFPLFPGYAIFNPSVLLIPSDYLASVADNKRSASSKTLGASLNKYLVAARASSGVHCPMRLGGARAGPNTRSHVMFGVSDAPHGPFEYCGVFSEYKGIDLPYDGPEDPRLFIVEEEKGRGMKASSSSSSIWMMVSYHGAMHRAQVSLKLDQQTSYGRHEGAGGRTCSVTVGPMHPIVVEGIPHDRREKNWIAIPPRIPAADASSRNTRQGVSAASQALVIYSFNPMEVIALAFDPVPPLISSPPSSGLGAGDAILNNESRFTFKGPLNECISPKLRGSTNLLRHPNDPNRLIGLVHEHGTEYVPSHDPYTFYVCRVIEVVEVKRGEFTVTRLSDTFRFPGAGEGTCASPIFFPVGMNYLSRSAVDETQSKIFPLAPSQVEGQTISGVANVVPDDSEFTSISMGFMDCTSDAVLVRTADLLGSLRRVPEFNGRDCFKR